MDRIIFDRMTELDQVHWWYTARRKVLAALIGRELALPAKAKILEIGCGTGHNVPMLRAFGEVDAVELDDVARDVASKRLGITVNKASLPDLPGVEQDHYDLVALFDVIEHVENDKAALISIAARLKAGGRILLTVPAHQWMWSEHDVLNHHFRRYSKKALAKLVADSGMKLDQIGYFNSLLFPVAILARAVGKLTGKKDSDDKLPPSIINKVFNQIFGVEAFLVGRSFLPGLSLFAIVSAK